MKRRASRLSSETSPYLLKHAGNPVDWFPWGEEALTKAKAENKPIFLSIGYAACHWCHVMERESFEDASIGELLNEHFISIKVDREERPDLDEIYMAATVALNGTGGWPMSVFLTPEGEPFFAGTYFPPEDRGGRPGFDTLLARIHEMWTKQREELNKQAADLTTHVRANFELGSEGGVSEDSIRSACRSLEQHFDEAFGGFSGAPKFPPVPALRLLLRYHQRTGEAKYLHMATRTLDAMMTGGIYDQLGGGFCRYSVDEKWMVPHFEKMLYDNALLADVYLEAYQVTGHEPYRRVCTEVLDYALRDMQSPDGGFFCASDADSEGKEGTFFCFTRDEITEALGEPHATYFSEFYGATTEGNFDGTNVLSARRTFRGVAKDLGVPEHVIIESLENSKAALFQARQKRVAPAIDDKLLASFNGLMIGALANAGRATSDGRYLEAAIRAAEFVLGNAEKNDGMRLKNGRLLRSARAGVARIPAFLDDYAFVSDGLLSLYEAGAGAKYLEAAKELTDTMLALFSSEDSGALYLTASDHEKLLARPRDARDAAIPNANAIACRVLARLGAHTENAEYRQRAERLAQSFSLPLKRAPRAHMELLCSVDSLLQPPLEVALTGSPEDETWQKMADILGTSFLPHRIETRITREDDISELAPLTKGRTAEATRVFLCENFTCDAPISEPHLLQKRLSEHKERSSEKRKKELGAALLPGAADPQATKEHLAKTSLETEQLDGLTISGLGLGGYRVGLDHPQHRASLEKAFVAGLNWFDTSPSFAFGDSERLFGQVLSQLVSKNQIERAAIVVMSKIGVALGAEAEALERRRSDEALQLDFAVPLGGAQRNQGDASLGHGAFCLDTAFLEEQLKSTCARLGVENLDYCLVQSPEHALEAGRNRDELLQALEDAFAFLEAEVEAGHLRGYGVLSTTLDRPRTDPLHLTVTELVSAAARANPKGHHFKILQLPINLMESSALEPGGAAQAAKEEGLSVIACRPLSATSSGALLRLAEPPQAEDGATADSLKSARYQVASLEAQFETTFAASLRLAKKIGSEAVLPLTGALGQTLEQVQTRQQFELAEATLLTPRLRHLIGQLDQALSGPGEENWKKFKTKYIQAVGAWLAAIRETASEKNRALLAELDETLQAQGPFQAARKHENWEGSDWASRALRALRQQNTITGTLVGLRTPGQVEFALRILGAPATKQTD